MAMLDCRGRSLDLSRPQVMGILNTTPDSFSDGGQVYRGGQLDLDAAVRRAAQMARWGASIIDIGGESTRPGAIPVSLQQEMDRVMPVVERVVAEVDAVVSVDTSSAMLMTAATNAGAGLINDVRALTRSDALAAAAKAGVPVCLMHMQGKPSTMQDAPAYDDVVSAVVDFFNERIHACEAVGIARNNLVLDPGFGFGKTLAHNLTLLARLSALRVQGLPLLVGLSRKSMIAQLLERSVDERMPASVALALLAVERGAAIVRVHDVKETVDALNISTALRELDKTNG